MKTSDEKVCYIDSEYYRLADHLSRLPHRILQHHHLETLPQMILHELGHDKGFGFKRAVYLVDNPDFDHLVGAAGFCKDECKHHQKDLWINPSTFCHDMKQASFHHEARQLALCSLARKDVNIQDAPGVKEIGEKLGMQHCEVFSWNMKHGNHGILICDPGRELEPWRRALLSNFVALLSLCGM
jgi:hypothetical protein